MTICIKCKKEKTVNDFYHYSYLKQNRCKSCIQTYYKNWYSKNGRKKTKKDSKYLLKWRHKNRKKDKAAHQLSESVRLGKIIRPLVCNVCGLVKRIYGHHENYNKPLEVLWVCGSCHKIIHNKKIV